MKWLARRNNSIELFQNTGYDVPTATSHDWRHINLLNAMASLWSNDTFSTKNKTHYHVKCYCD